MFETGKLYTVSSLIMFGYGDKITEPFNEIEIYPGDSLLFLFTDLVGNDNDVCWVNFLHDNKIIFRLEKNTRKSWFTEIN